MTLDTDIDKTYQWFREVYPDPTTKNLHTQLGVHFEEIAEMLEAMDSLDTRTNKLICDAYDAIHVLAEHLKKSDKVIIIDDRIEFLDAICDQIVTAVGCGHHANMNVTGALGEVNRSNFSKFDENGRALLDENQKVAKSINYRRADLTPYV